MNNLFFHAWKRSADTWEYYLAKLDITTSQYGEMCIGAKGGWVSFRAKSKAQVIAVLDAVIKADE